MITAERYHDFSCGHRVHGHESKCAFLHGHNYRVTFMLRGHYLERPDDGTGAPFVVKSLDSVGRVLDFSVIKSKLCVWLEENWDHKFLAWKEDPVMLDLLRACGTHERTVAPDTAQMFASSLVLVPFNPTAENMASYLLDVIGPSVLRGSGAKLISVRVEETRKCSATADLF